jgi:hypothetical protein
MPIRSCSRATLERARCNYSRIPVGDDISPCFGLSGASARWQNMKSRHAAALALVGWYLMAPPLYKGEVEEKAPLKKWTVLQSFGTVAECSQWLSVMLDKADLDPATRTVVQHRLLAASCVSTDDPRLKEK